MLYRSVAAIIVIFWLVMMALLVKIELHPDETDILDVPVPYVMHLLFKHAQISILTVQQEGAPIGTISVRPALTGTTGSTLESSGALNMMLPLGSRQRLNYNGGVDMDNAMRVRAFHLDVSNQEQHTRLNLHGDFARKVFTFEVRMADRVVAEQTLPMDLSNLEPVLLQNAGLQGTALPGISSSIAPPVVTARETQIRLHGEKLQVYEVTVMEASARVLDFYVTEVGQIVLARTNFGYSFATEDAQ
jgi:hypothetical protein